ncbi:BolA-like domain containing protein [Nitzschia inconspicua]|uniref:BolA-like domain containing protein n=1 Tax=Nitzschia inconspicua TaxID=303405 RepID=A0A9K3PMB6_9STRA|nr:BolA-like domain containing protein [Nitzschia inconspicua]
MSSTSPRVPSFPVTESIRQKLADAFHPQVLEVINESHMHNVPKNSETHFKVVVVSEQFDSIKSPLQRHRLVNAALATELEGPVHALSIVAKSPAQWESNQSIPASPNCKGGDGSLPKKSSAS